MNNTVKYDSSQAINEKLKLMGKARFFSKKLLDDEVFDYFMRLAHKGLRFLKKTSECIRVNINRVFFLFCCIRAWFKYRDI